MKSANTPDAQMRALKEWAIERMSAGTQTPWAWFQFMKLLEVIDTFLDAGDDAGLRDKLPTPDKRVPARLSANVVALDAARLRAAE